MKEQAVYKDTDYDHYKSVLKTPDLSKLDFFLKYNGNLRFSKHSLDSLHLTLRTWKPWCLQHAPQLEMGRDQRAPGSLSPPS